MSLTSYQAAPPCSREGAKIGAGPLPVNGYLAEAR